MSYFDDYKKRLQAQGSDFTDSLLNSTSEIFDQNFSKSPTYFEVTKNGSTTIGVRVLNDSDANKRVVLSRENDVNLGDLIDHKTNKWLVTELPVNNRVYDKSEMVLCNNTLTIKGEPTKTQTGTDDLGRPVYEYTDGTDFVTPCVVQSDKEMYSNDQEQINIPEGKIVLHVQYTNQVNIEDEFTMFNDSYIVTGVDMSKTINNEGVLIVLAEKTQ